MSRPTSGGRGTHDGSAWLLPAYRFIDSDGGWHTVPAVTDEFLIQADPVVIDEPLPAPEPAPVTVDPALPVETVPPSDTKPPVDTTTPGDTMPPVDIEPGADPAVAISSLEPFVGLSLEEFSAEAKALGFETRVVVQDGESLAATDDYRTDRVNVAVEGAAVVSIESIG